jgi:endonuclease/exonuclease/phosphatase family metal-dependent hydrolase
VVACVAREDWPALRARDQLLKAMAAGDAFDGFREAPLAFPPTYKLIRNAEDVLRYKENRRPAWCDRVVFRGDLACAAYGCVPSALSDHAPVYADLSWADAAPPLHRQVAQTPVRRDDRSGLGAAGWFGSGGAVV